MAPSGLRLARAVLADNRQAPRVSPQMQEKAKEIYMTFLSSKASSQVNVEGQSRLNEKILEEPHPLMFQKLQDQVTGFPQLHLDSKTDISARPPQFGRIQLKLNTEHLRSSPIHLGGPRHVEGAWLVKETGWPARPRI